MADYNTYGIGNCGYAPEGTVGIDGKNGTSTYYTPYSFDDDMSKIQSCILAGKALSNNTNAQISGIEYKVNDLIIGLNSEVYIITDISTSSVSLERLGKIVTDTNAGSQVDKYEAPEYVTFVIESAETDSANEYNYIHDVPDEDKSPYYHHRDVYDSSVYGNYISCDEIPYDNKTMDMKIVINFNSGLSYTAPVMSTSASFFIDNRYFYPYGHAESTDIQYWDTSVFTYDDERNIGTVHASENCAKMFSENKICDGYLEYSYKNTNSTKVYRVPIKF